MGNYKKINKDAWNLKTNIHINAQRINCID